MHTILLLIKQKQYFLSLKKKRYNTQTWPIYRFFVTCLIVHWLTTESSVIYREFTEFRLMIDIQKDLFCQRTDLL